MTNAEALFCRSNTHTDNVLKDIYALRDMTTSYCAHNSPHGCMCRPGAIIGHSPRSYMNLLHSIAVYGTVHDHLEHTFHCDLLYVFTLASDIAVL